jgi:hypothetical protein
MPDSVGYTSPIIRERAIGGVVWIVNWSLPADKTWVYVASAIPAFLAFILLFVGIQFTEYYTEM